MGEVSLAVGREEVSLAVKDGGDKAGGRFRIATKLLLIENWILRVEGRIGEIAFRKAECGET